MTPFNAELAMQGKPVITRDGRKVEEIYLFKKIRGGYPIAAVINGCITTFNKDGNPTKVGFKVLSESDLDLFMDEPTPETKEVFINVYWLGGRSFSQDFDNEKQAKDIAEWSCRDKTLLLQTIKALVPVNKSI